MAKKVSPATEGYSANGRGAFGGDMPHGEGTSNTAPGKKVFKAMTLSRQNNDVKATHSFVDPKHDNEHYIFGEGEQKGLMNHIGKHLGFTKLTGKKNAPESPEDQNASAVNNAAEEEK